MVKSLEGLDWTEIARQAQAGKNLTGKLKTMAAEVSTEAEEAADHIKGWKQRIPGGASELACEAIRATSKGQENAPDKLDQWQWTAKAQATNAVEALKDFEAKAERERRDGQAKDLR
ncbi:hypothetical protein HDE_13226 [Halotydeus destructor]|nr:hypothetical protein HDE_13226 [Halotydeus destructor]